MNLGRRFPIQTTILSSSDPLGNSVLCTFVHGPLLHPQDSSPFQCSCFSASGWGKSLSRFLVQFCMSLSPLVPCSTRLSISTSATSRFCVCRQDQLVLSRPPPLEYCCARGQKAEVLGCPHCFFPSQGRRALVSCAKSEESCYTHICPISCALGQGSKSALSTESHLETQCQNCFNHYYTLGKTAFQLK